MRVVDLFSGCGGLSLGFEKAGFKIIKAFDNWRPAVETYNLNFTHQCEKLDLSTEDAIIKISELKPEIIIGGPPCQDFSIAGKGNHQGDKANLTLSFAKIVSKIKPDIFVMENVYNIERMNILKEAIEIFKKNGYGLTSKIWDASFMNVPQSRKRFIMIGKIGEQDNFLLEILKNNLSKKQTTLRDYLGNSLKTEYYYMHPRSYARRAIYSIDEPSATIRGVNRPIPQNYQFHDADKSKNLKNIRALTTVERSYIQTFPNNYSWAGTKTEVEQLIGNAVPVNMAYFIAKGIKEYINTKK